MGKVDDAEVRHVEDDKDTRSVACASPVRRKGSSRSVFSPPASYPVSGSLFVGVRGQL
jgi:hypothetical protein